MQELIDQLREEGGGTVPGWLSSQEFKQFCGDFSDHHGYKLSAVTAMRQVIAMHIPDLDFTAYCDALDHIAGTASLHDIQRTARGGVKLEQRREKPTLSSLHSSVEFASQHPIAHQIVVAIYHVLLSLGQSENGAIAAQCIRDSLHLGSDDTLVHAEVAQHLPGVTTVQSMTKSQVHALMLISHINHKAALAIRSMLEQLGIGENDLHEILVRNDEGTDAISNSSLRSLHEVSRASPVGADIVSLASVRQRLEHRFATSDIELVRLALLLPPEEREKYLMFLREQSGTQFKRNFDAKKEAACIQRLFRAIADVDEKLWLVDEAKVLNIQSMDWSQIFSLMLSDVIKDVRIANAITGDRDVEILWDNLLTVAEEIDVREQNIRSQRPQTIQDLCVAYGGDRCWTEEDLRQIKQVGNMSIVVINGFLARIGLHLPVIGKTEMLQMKSADEVMEQSGERTALKRMPITHLCLPIPVEKELAAVGITVYGDLWNPMDELPPLKVGKGHSADADEESNFPKVQNYALMMKENLVRWGLMDSGDKSPFGWIDLRIALHKGIVRSETPLSSLGFPGDILEALRAIGIKTVGGLKSKGEALPLPQAVNGTSVSLLDEPSSLGPRIADHLGSIMPELAKKPRDRFDWISARYEEYCKKRTLAAKTTRS